jgi:hypothetical protein
MRIRRASGGRWVIEDSASMSPIMIAYRAALMRIAPPRLSDRDAPQTVAPQLSPHF